ncbi:OmpP1/FadL family transporter [Nitratifractor sp.]|uniref:OmpP1/FadL family transporter n=1 Tax=Nitratifractor sp. TaxID=2268144 RepID=UPI0025D49AD3|nr:OmpP1/FadL family transporter [Nitratifractor sp.]
MKRCLKGALLLGTAVAGLNAAGYKLPEQSVSSMALGAAYVAHTTGADTAYYNPANMAFMDPQRQYVEGALTWVHLPAIDYEGKQYLPSVGLVPADGSTKVENIPVGHLFYVSPAYGAWRFGMSVAAPGGLSKRWDNPVQKLFAEEFTLKIIEANPSVAYRINDQWSIGAGVRMVYTDGRVKSDGMTSSGRLARDMNGDSVDWGYNLAVSYRPSKDWNFAVTYRSNVNLTVEGTATLYAGSPTTPIYRGGARVTVPLPATLDIAAAKTFDDVLTVELVYERTFWSKYKKLDFNYDASLPVFDDPIDKSWKDSNTFRLGLSYRYNDRLTLMGGYAYDQTPVPDRTLGYELPDSDGNIFSAGFLYRQTENFAWGVAVLYDHKKSRSLSLGENENGIVGTFKKGGAFLSTLGFRYRF